MENKIVRAIPIGWPGLIGNVVPFSSVCWSLTSWPGIMESILNVWGLQPTNNTMRRDPFPVFFLKDRGGWRGKMGIGIIFFFSGKWYLACLVCKSHSKNGTGIWEKDLGPGKGIYNPPPPYVVASWLVCMTPDHMVQVQVLAGDIVSYSWWDTLLVVQMGTGKFNAGGNTVMDWYPIQGGVQIFLVVSCYRNRDKLGLFDC